MQFILYKAYYTIDKRLSNANYNAYKIVFLAKKILKSEFNSKALQKIKCKFLAKIITKILIKDFF